MVRWNIDIEDELAGQVEQYKPAGVRYFRGRSLEPNCQTVKKRNK
jgi:hypothetical protein